MKITCRRVDRDDLTGRSARGLIAAHQQGHGCRLERRAGRSNWPEHRNLAQRPPGTPRSARDYRPAARSPAVSGCSTRNFDSFLCLPSPRSRIIWREKPLGFSSLLDREKLFVQCDNCLCGCGFRTGFDKLTDNGTGKVALLACRPGERWVSVMPVVPPLIPRPGDSD